MAAVFLQPCVYGSGLTKDLRYKRTGKNTPEGLCPDTLGEWAVIWGACVLGSIVPCLTGIYMRSVTENSNGEHMLSAIMAECCPLCSCAPCQMNQYRLKGGDVTANML